MRNKYAELEIMRPEIWRLHKRGLSSYKIAEEIFNPLTLASFVRERISTIQKKIPEPTVMTLMDSKLLNMTQIDMRTWYLHEKGLDATRIAQDIFNPQSLSRWVRHQITAMKKMGWK
jgi:dTDP-4-dehydrorhamnose reductase